MTNNRVIRSIKNLFCISIIYSLFINTVFAFELEYKNNKTDPANHTSEFVFQSYPNQQLIPIRILGEVKKSGLYYIPAEMKLITLLSLAGGTTSEANLEKIIISNDQTKVKDTNGEEKNSLLINLEDTLKNGAKTDYVLKSNDIILIESKKPFISSDSFRVITILSLILTSTLTALAIKNKI